MVFNKSAPTEKVCRQQLKNESVQMEDANQSAEGTPVQFESFRQKAPESAGEGICRCIRRSEAHQNAFVVSKSC